MKKNFSTSLGIMTLMAASVMSPGSKAQNNVTSCADIEDAEERLSCYDRVAEATRNMPVIRLPRAERTTIAPVASGNDSQGNSVRGDSFGYGEQRDGPRTRTYRVVAARHNDFTGWTLEFDNGSTWKQVGTDDYRIEIGEQYSVRRNSFNSYMLSNFENNRKIRISRVE